MPIRWGLLGCGDIANKRVADAILRDENSELVAACRRDENQLRSFADAFSIPYVTTSADELIGRTDLDAIYIATPVDLHCPQTIAAAESGKHVLVEKPMAISSDECQQMIDACDRAGVTLGVAYYRRFYPMVLRMAQLLEQGAIGRPLSILATTGNPNRFPPDDWRVDVSRGGGGPLMDIGSHRLDLFLMLFGSITGVQSNCIASGDYEAEQAATLLMEFESGAHGVLQCYFGTTNTPDRLEIIGTDGRLSTDDLNGAELLVVQGDVATTETHPPPANFHAPLIADFTEAIEQHRAPTVNGPIGLATNKLIQTAYRAGLPSDCE